LRCNLQDDFLVWVASGASQIGWAGRYS
jgi:hypothetical protein